MRIKEGKRIQKITEAKTSEGDTGEEKKGR